MARSGSPRRESASSAGSIPRRGQSRSSTSSGGPLARDGSRRVDLVHPLGRRHGRAVHSVAGRLRIGAARSGSSQSTPVLPGERGRAGKTQFETPFPITLLRSGFLPDREPRGRARRRFNSSLAAAWDCRCTVPPNTRGDCEDEQEPVPDARCAALRHWRCPPGSSTQATLSLRSIACATAATFPSRGSVRCPLWLPGRRRAPAKPGQGCQGRDSRRFGSREAGKNRLTGSMRFT